MSWPKAENANLAPQRVVHRKSIGIAVGWTEMDIAGYRGVVHVADSRTHPGAEIDVWYERVTADDVTEVVGFEVHGTGHTFNSNGQHVGTVLTHNGQLVWHVYASTLGVIQT